MVMAREDCLDEVGGCSGGYCEEGGVWGPGW